MGWRLSLGLVGIPAVLVLLGSLALPETPSSLMQRGHEQEARRVSLIPGTSASHICAVLKVVGSVGGEAGSKQRALHTLSRLCMPADDAVLLSVCELSPKLQSATAEGLSGPYHLKSLPFMQVLESVRGTAEVEAELAEIRKAAGNAKASSGGLVLFRHRRHLPQLLWCIAMPIMQQYTGINAFMFYGEYSGIDCPLLLS